MVLASGAAVAAASGQRRGPCRRRLPGRIPRLDRVRVRVRVRLRVRVRVYRVRVTVRVLTLLDQAPALRRAAAIDQGYLVRRDAPHLGVRERGRMRVSAL